MQPARSRRAADPLGYAFSTDGWLDPGTKLLDVGLDGYTPLAALRTLVDQPLHMSVALHEVTHFESLENALGHVMGFLAMRANSIAEALAEHGQSGAPVEPSWIGLYSAWHGRYRLLLELWRPLLEGLAVFAQTHRPNPDGDALIEPLSLLWHWKLSMVALCRTQPPGLTLEQLDGGFLQAAYRAIGQGARLRQGERTLAACIELLDPPSLRPYFLGHAYVRALQRALAARCADYESGELFFQLVLRILRSSTHGVLAGELRWDEPATARRIYGWLDIVRRAPAERVAALRSHSDAVDVLHFLATGEARAGYAGGMRESVAVLRELIPAHWKNFESELGRWDFDRIAQQEGDAPPGWSAEEIAQRLAAGWMRGAMTLNLSTRGRIRIAGWIPRGLAPLHALALQVDDALWWLAAGDADLALLAGVASELPQLPQQALLDAFDTGATPREVLIDCYTSHEAVAAAAPDEAPRMRSVLQFELAPVEGASRSLLTELAPAQVGVARAHLRVVADDRRHEMHRRTMQMRHMLRDVPGPIELFECFDERRRFDVAKALLEVIGSENRAAARVQAQVERCILGALLERAPSGDDLELLAQGIAAVPGAAAFEPLIAAAYSLPVPVDAAVADAVRALNARARHAIGKELFEFDRGRVLYRGLWGAPCAESKEQS